MHIKDTALRHSLIAFLAIIVLALPIYGANNTKAADAGKTSPTNIAEIRPNMNTSVSNEVAPQSPAQKQPQDDRGKWKKQISYGSAIIAGILLSILGTALHAWLGFAALCIIAQKIAPLSFLDQISVPYLTTYTLRSPEFLTFLIVACIVETLQKWIPFVKVLFNFLNTAIKPVLAALMIGMIAKFANPDISNLVLRPMEYIGGFAVFGLHIGKHVVKAGTSAHFNPPATWAWAAVELIVTVVVVGLGAWVLV